MRPDSLQDESGGTMTKIATQKKKIDKLKASIRRLQTEKAESGISHAKQATLEFHQWKLCAAREAMAQLLQESIAS
jgi:hypothetical protein